jgi:hypothetical protein
VAGVDDRSYYKPLLLNSAKTVTINSAPPAGTCRRDIIAVSWQSGLTDGAVSDVLNPATQTFGGATKYKTLSWALDDSVVQTLPVGGNTAANSNPILYIPGGLSTYSTADDLLNAPLPSYPSTHTAVAIINVVPGMTAVYQNMIVDYRRRLFPSSVAKLQATPTIGSTIIPPMANPGNYLNNAGVAGSQGISAYLSKTSGFPGTLPADYTNNEYQLTVLGVRNAASLALNLAPILAHGNLRGFGYQLLSVQANVVADSSVAALLNDPIRTPEGAICAIGQPYSAIQFRCGYLELMSSPYQTTTYLKTDNVYWDQSGSSTTLPVNMDASIWHF